jgi:proteasome maturation protein
MLGWEEPVFTSLSKCTPPPILRLQEHITKMQMLTNLYGSAVPARMSIESQILGRVGQRLPGLPSSRLGLESLTGELDEFGFESFLGLPEFSEEPPVDLHSQMEQRLGLGSKPLARGMPF